MEIFKIIISLKIRICQFCILMNLLKQLCRLLSYLKAKIRLKDLLKLKIVVVKLKIKLKIIKLIQSRNYNKINRILVLKLF